MNLGKKKKSEGVNKDHQGVERQNSWRKDNKMKEPLKLKQPKLEGGM